MRNLLARLRQHLPQRRRRFWRYVSPRRQGVGLAVLLVLLGLFYGYWYLTNDARIRRMAEDFLRDSTGGVVSVESAQFHLFGGIELRGVRIYTPDGSTTMPAMKAPSLIIRHDPWRLLATGQLYPTEVVCNQPVVNIVYLEDGTNIWQRMFNARKDKNIRDDGGGGGPMIMPPVQFRQGMVRFWQKVGQTESNTLDWPLEVTATRTGDMLYEVVFPNGRGLLNMATGQMVRKDFHFPEGLPLQSLPPKYRQLLQRYQIEKGSYRLTSQSDGKMLIRPENASMKLPADQGGLSFTQVRGDIILDPKAGQVVLRDVTGLVPEAGDARFVINGQYGGQDPQWSLQDSDAPCQIEVTLANGQIPQPGVATEQFGRLLRQLHDLLAPEGRFAARATISRQGGGPLQVDGRVDLLDMQVTYRDFPYPLKDLSGTVGFDQTGIRKLDLQAMQKRLHLAGSVQAGDSGLAMDVELTGQSIDLDERLYRALPAQLRTVWDQLAPRGQANLRVAVSKPADADKPDLDLVITLAGKAGITFQPFAYPLESMTGRVRLRDDDVELLGIESYQDGRRLCTINGSIVNVDSPDWSTDLTIDIDRLKIDQTLLDALQEPVRKAVARLHPSGMVDSAKVRVHQSRNTPLDFRVLAEIADGRILYEDFPYELTDLNGSVAIYPDRAEIEPGPQGKGMSGRHGSGKFLATGEILFGKTGRVEMDIQGQSVALDDSLRQALPPRVREVWDLLSVGGRTNMTLQLRGPEPNRPERPFDYKLVLLPTDMSLRFRHFPLTLQGVSGRVTAVPGKVSLDQLSINDGPRKLQLVGQILTEDNRQHGKLKVIARNLPIDQEFIDAVPADILPAVRRLKAKGTCSIDLNELEFVAIDPETPDGDKQIEWASEGSFAVTNAALDLGMDIEQITGSYTGKISSGAKGAMLNGKVEVDSMAMGSRKITDLTAGVSKPQTGDVVSLTGLNGKAHGGKLAGFAEIKLADDVEYGLSLEVDRINLDSLVNAGIEDPDKKTQMQGLMAGRISLIAKGQMEDWKAEGRIQISNARIYRLPIFLGLLHVVYLTLPTDSAFTEAQVGYELRKGKLVFSELHLNGNALSLLGSGNLTLADDSLRLTFIAGPPGKMPTLGAVSEQLLRLIAKELMVIEVRGTLKNPRITTVPLKGLQAIIDAILAPSRDAN